MFHFRHKWGEWIYIHNALRECFYWERWCTVCNSRETTVCEERYERNLDSGANSAEPQEKLDIHVSL